MTPYRASDLGIDIASVDRNFEDFRSLPIHTYFDPRVYDFELGAIFDSSWQYFAPLEKLAAPGDVVAGRVGRVPIAVARAEDGELYGFVNICRHRGYSVVRGDKRNCRRLVCGYHAWSYRLNGQLAAAPDTENELNFDPAEHGLLPVSVDTWGPAVFVNPDPQAISLRATHPQLETWAVEREFVTDPEHYRLHREVVSDQQGNWKLWYDNGVECYHCPLIHGRSFGEAFKVADGQYSHRLDGRMMSYAFDAGDGGDGEHLRSATYRSFQIFPGCQIIQQDDIMILAKMVPTGPESCRFTAHYLAEKSADPERVERWLEVWARTYDEDAAAIAVQQANLKSGRAREFRYVSKREEPALFINRLIWDAYKAHLAPGGAGPQQHAAE